MINFVFFSIFVISIAILYKTLRKAPSIPKGLKELPYEIGLPIIGVLHQIKVPLPVYFTNLGKKHGSLFRLRFGMRDIVVLNNYDVIKKTLKDDGDNFAGRYKIMYFKETSKNVGLLFHDGQMWAKQRAFVLNVFREFGVNTSKYVDIIQDECSLFLNKLGERNEDRIDFENSCRTPISNIISKFVINKRFDTENEAIKNFGYVLAKTSRSKNIFHILNLMFPFLDDSTLFLKFWKFTSFEWNLMDEIYNYYREEINEHLEKLDFNSEGEDLIDRFLIMQREMKTKTGNVDSFTDWQLIRNIYELFIAGFETLSTTLGWSLMFMSKYPEIQDTVYLEIIDKIGNKEPSMSDKVSLVYTQAVMDEIFRMSSVAPLTLSHQTLNDSSVNGFFIPKKSIVFPNLYACHHDPNTWEKPMEFNPGRFLLVNNREELKYKPREDLIPFGLGKRQCLGESLARMEYFIFFTRILQKYRVSFSEEISEKKYKEVLLANDGIIRHCSIQTFNFSIRN